MKSILCVLIAIVFFVSFVFLLIFYYTGHKISDTDLSKTRLYATRYRIMEYYSINGMPPDKLDALPGRQGYSDSLFDSWGNLILYKVSGNEVLLASFGKDGTPGGKNIDEDMYLQFSFVDSDYTEQVGSSLPANSCFASCDLSVERGGRR